MSSGQPPKSCPLEAWRGFANLTNITAFGGQVDHVRPWTSRHLAANTYMMNHSEGKPKLTLVPSDLRRRASEWHGRPPHGLRPGTGRSSSQSPSSGLTAELRKGHRFPYQVRQGAAKEVMRQPPRNALADYSVYGPKRGTRAAHRPA